MLSGQQSSTYDFVSELIYSLDPDEILIEKYSSLVDSQKEKLEFCRQYLHHFDVKKRINSLLSQIQEIKERINLVASLSTPKKQNSTQQKNIRHEQNSQSNQNTNRTKRMRRAANQISRHFHCPIQSCKKEYGSEGSLNQHIKLKHSFLVKTSEHSNSNQKIQQNFDEPQEKIENNQPKIEE